MYIYTHTYAQRYTHLHTHGVAEKYAREQEGESLSSPCTWTVDSSGNLGTLQLLGSKYAPTGQQQVSGGLPDKRTFRIFDRCFVKMTLKPSQSPYRRPRPLFMLLWNREGKALLPSQVKSKQSSSVYAHKAKPSARQKQQKVRTATNETVHTQKAIEQELTSSASMYNRIHEEIQRATPAAAEQPRVGKTAVTGIGNRRAFKGWCGASTEPLDHGA